MKKTILVLVMILLLIIAGIFCYKCCDLEDPQDCEQLIFIAVNRIPEEDYTEWQTANQDYMYEVPTEEKKPGTQEGIVAIDASKIKSSDYPTWLKENGDFIFFEETYPYIECIHSVSASAITNIGTYYSLTLNQLKASISAAGGNYLTDNYNKYTTLSIGTSGLTIGMVNNFSATGHCYSVPFFRSIVGENNLSKNSVIQFATATVATKSTIIIKITNAGVTNYYDYSQIPP